ncbi:hypothetical protein [Chryseolinea serpens]|uniref:hypothetical protein n=1 Tax=Chryseolinea serpens TaxID=947013 RepID=UPI001C867940|nr:hypothetical protein [Chryseolinea serpens]
MLQQIAEALKVPVEAIENFTEEGANTYFNSFHDNSGPSAFQYNNSAPTDKYEEMVEKIEGLYKELLKEKQARIELLERLLAEKK